MPYYFDVLTHPADQEHFWERLEEIIYYVQGDLEGVHFETEEEALYQVYRKSLVADDLRFDSRGVARYRETDDRENLIYCYRMGKWALRAVKAGIKKRKVTAHFMNNWSVLLACHGFVAAAMMARGDDLQSKRAGLRGGEAKSIAAQQQWFSHYFLRLYRRSNRTAVEDAIEIFVNDFVSSRRPMPEGFDIEWFSKLVQPEGPSPRPLTTAFRDKKLSINRMRELVALPTDDLPPTDLELHTP